MASAGVSTGALAGADRRVRHSPHARPGQRDAMLILTSQSSREAGEEGTRRGLDVRRHRFEIAGTQGACVGSHVGRSEAAGGLSLSGEGASARVRRKCDPRAQGSGRCGVPSTAHGTLGPVFVVTRVLRARGVQP